MLSKGTIYQFNVKNNLKTRIAGTTILGTTGIFIAAIPASAASVLTIPIKNNSFGSTMGNMSQVYTFGFGKYETPMQRVMKILPMTKDSKNIKPINDLFSFDPSRIDSKLVDELANGKGEFIKQTKLLIRDKRTSKSIVKFLVSGAKNSNHIDFTNDNRKIIVDTISKLKKSLDGKSLGFNLDNALAKDLTSEMLHDKVKRF